MSAGVTFLFGIFVLWLVSRLRDRQKPGAYTMSSRQRRAHLRARYDLNPALDPRTRVR